jgi:hypothetical protein
MNLSAPRQAGLLLDIREQPNDDSLHKMADRIQARAIRRERELLQEIEASKGGRPKTQDGSDPRFTRTQAARGARTDLKPDAAGGTRFGVAQKALERIWNLVWAPTLGLGPLKKLDYPGIKL